MGTHPIFESDFDCLTEWAVVDRVPVNVDVALEAVHHVRRSRRKKVDGRDLDHGIVATEVAPEIENTGMNMTDGAVIDVDHVTERADQAVAQARLERIQSAGLKLSPSQSSHLTERPSSEKSSCSCAKT